MESRIRIVESQPMIPLISPQLLNPSLESASADLRYGPTQTGVAFTIVLLRLRPSVIQPILFPRSNGQVATAFDHSAAGEWSVVRSGVGARRIRVI